MLQSEHQALSRRKCGRTSTTKVQFPVSSFSMDFSRSSVQNTDLCRVTAAQASEAAAGNYHAKQQHTTMCISTLGHYFGTHPKGYSLPLHATRPCLQPKHGSMRTAWPWNACNRTFCKTDVHCSTCFPGAVLVLTLLALVRNLHGSLSPPLLMQQLMHLLQSSALWHSGLLARSHLYITIHMSRIIVHALCGARPAYVCA